MRSSTARRQRLQNHVHPAVSNLSGAAPLADNRISVSLLAQEQLALESEVLFDGITADDGVEVGLVLSALGSQDAPQPLCFLLAGAEHPGDLNRYRSFGQIDSEVRHFRDH